MIIYFSPPNQVVEWNQRFLEKASDVFEKAKYSEKEPNTKDTDTKIAALQFTSPSWVHGDGVFLFDRWYIDLTSRSVW